MRYLLAFVLAVLLLSSCNKKKPEPAVKGYVLGDVLVGINAGVSMDSVFRLFNSCGLNIKETHSFTYGVPYTPAQYDSVCAYLNTKSYVDSTHWKANVSYNSRFNQPGVFCFFF